MFYSAFGIIAVLILLIENQDILVKPRGTFEKPVWKVYQHFLLAVLVYYTADILWGALDSLKLRRLLFADTTVYFIAMSVGILFWARFTVAYMEDRDDFGQFIISLGRVIAGLITLLAVVNIFTPVLFRVDADGTYEALPLRYMLLLAQISLLLMISIYAVAAYIQLPAGNKAKYRSLTLFGFIMAAFLFAQLFLPRYPLYTIAYTLGTCLLHTFVINDEKEAYRLAMEEASRSKELTGTITSLLDNLPGMTFTRDVETGVYLACNRAFARFARRENPDDVVGWTDAELFDPVTAEHFAEDSKVALSMDEPYIFYEDVEGDDGAPRQFQTTQLKYTDDRGRLCLLGICQDVTDIVRVQRQHAATPEAYEKARSTGIVYSHIAQAMTRGFRSLYYVNADSEEFIEYTTDEATGALQEVRRGYHFFEECQIKAEEMVYAEDCPAVKSAMERKTLVDAIDRNKVFVMTYRVNSEAGPIYVSMRASRMEDDERYIILGITDVDEQTRQRREAERMREEHLAYTRLNALTGDFLCVYVVVPETGRYREFSASTSYETLGQAKVGDDFFAVTRESARTINYPEDVNRFLSSFTRENILAEVERHGIYTLSYRIMMSGSPHYVQLKAAMVDEKEGRRLIVGISDIDAQVRQEEDYVRTLAKAQIDANVDALTGVKNRHAYLVAEERLNTQILEGKAPGFAVVILDVNDLKTVNDTQGHKEGDKYLRRACKYICEVFRHSPVFRVGGDEFVVISQGGDYQRMDALIDRVNRHNEEALRGGGIVIACGMARFENDSSVAAVFERADQIMYDNKCGLKQRKKAGRAEA